MNATAVAELEPPAPRRSGPSLTWLWLVVGALLVAGVVSAFVVVDDDERDPGERLAAAGATASEEDFAFEATVEGGPAAGAEVQVTGQVDVETRRMRAGIGLGGLTLDLIQDGTVQYYELPSGGAGKPWRRFDLATLGMPAQQAPAGGNPLDAYAQLGAIVGDVERVGEEEVRGEDTVHFRAVVDATKGLPASAGRRPGIEALRRVPVDVWLDHRDRPRRFRQALTLPDGDGGMELVTTVESYDYGKDVTIDLPPADQVEDVTDLSSLFAPTPTD